MSTPRAPTKSMTYEEFLAWCDEDTRAEWVDGEVIMLAPASNRHQDLVRFLVQVIGLYVERHGLGVIRSAPFQMYIPELARGREPDLVYVAQENKERLKETHLEGPADLTVEISSPESRLRDRGEKLAEYEMGGVREYWLIDPEERRADFYVLDSEGRYERRTADADGLYRSEVLQGLALRVEWLWQDPLPPVLQILKELALI
ncbi:MAG: Uma2 family endonuclease [Candidatus Bipolaricaulota bacterium]